MKSHATESKKRHQETSETGDISDGRPHTRATLARPTGRGRACCHGAQANPSPPASPVIQKAS